MLRTRRCGPLWIAERVLCGVGLPPCPRARRHCLRTSSDERHQNRPYSDQTKRHPGSGDISAHRPSPALRRMAIAAPASRWKGLGWSGFVASHNLRCPENGFPTRWDNCRLGHRIYAHGEAASARALQRPHLSRALLASQPCGCGLADLHVASSDRPVAAGRLGYLDITRT